MKNRMLQSKPWIALPLFLGGALLTQKSRKAHPALWICGLIACSLGFILCALILAILIFFLAATVTGGL